MKQFAILGYPLGHTLSPQLHRLLARELGEPRGLTLADPEAFRLAAAAWDWGDGMSCAEYWRRA